MGKRRKGGRPQNTRTTRERRPLDTFVGRPFEGLTDEPEWIALRELVPAATAPLALAPSLMERYGERQVTLATLLPMASPAMAGADGRVLVGLQRHAGSGDLNRDLAAALLAALETPAGRVVEVPDRPGEGPRLAEVIVDRGLDVEVHDRFDFWVDGAGPDPAVSASLERANESIYPTVRMAAVPAAYWCQVPGRAHLRWVLAEPEDAALNGLARVGAAGGLKLGADTRFAGMFRAHGLLVPVWDLPHDTPAGHWEEPLAGFAKRYADSLAAGGELDPAARRARQGLVGRQLTLR